MGDAMAAVMAFLETIWQWISQSKFSDLSIMASLLLVAAVRPAWLLFKVILYSLFINISSWPFIIRGCVRLWLWTNWDIGSALLGMVRDSWTVDTQTIGIGHTEVGMRVHHRSGNGMDTHVGSRNIHIPGELISSQIEPHSAKRGASKDIDNVDKRRLYVTLFQARLGIVTEEQSARSFEKQVRGKWYRVRVIARWIQARIRQFAEYVRP